MKRVIRLLVLCVLPVILVFGAVPGFSTVAQEDASDETVTALQTQVAALSTQVASLAPQQTSAPVQDSAPGNVLFESAWSEGLGGWFGTEDWQVSEGMLVNSGSNDFGEIAAPYRPEGSNFAVEAEIQVLSLPEIDWSWDDDYVDADGDTGCDDQPRFWLFIDYADGETNAAIAGVDFPECPIGNSLASLFGDGDEPMSRPFNPASEWRTYRLEVRGDEVRYLIDGGLVAEDQLYRDAVGTSTDAEYILGFRDSLVGLNVGGFRVIALDEETTG